MSSAQSAEVDEVGVKRGQRCQGVIENVSGGRFSLLLRSKATLLRRAE